MKSDSFLPGSQLNFMPPWENILETLPSDLNPNIKTLFTQTHPEGHNKDLSILQIIQNQTVHSLPVLVKVIIILI